MKVFTKNLRFLEKMADPAKITCRYLFGNFVLDNGARLLFRGGESIPLALKEFDTLQMLVEYAGRTVEKDNLVRRVWPDSFVGDSSLAKNISILRKHLGADAIQTVPKRGYRFTLPVSVAAAEGSQPQVVPSPMEALPAAAAPAVPLLPTTWELDRTSTRKLWRGGLGLVACLLLMGFLVRTRKSGSPDVYANPTHAIRVAVLPFQDAPGSSPAEYLSDGIVEELITALGQANSNRLRVLAKGSSAIPWNRQEPGADRAGIECSVPYRRYCQAVGWKSGSKCTSGEWIGSIRGVGREILPATGAEISDSG
ncbi:MAG: winged helix-turn-helix domain-containing protein [Candidatus Sulfotelmatobacter sp.]